VSSKIVIQLAATALLIALNNAAIAQPAVTPLPQSTQPQISEQTKALFRQRWADGPAAAAANNSATSTTQTAAQFVPATAKPNAAAANPPSENRANQQAYLDKINQAMKGK
jgi:hypothetical protein